jgi:hypothetical protein
VASTCVDSGGAALGEVWWAGVSVTFGANRLRFDDGSILIDLEQQLRDKLPLDDGLDGAKHNERQYTRWGRGDSRKGMFWAADSAKEERMR